MIAEDEHDEPPHAVMVVARPSCHTGFAIDSILRERTLEVYNQVVSINPFEAKAMTLGFLALLLLLLHQSETFDRLVSCGIKGPLYLAYGTYGLPLMLLLMEIQRRIPRRPGGGFRILGVLVLVALLMILGVLALIAFLIYRYLRRRRR